MNSVPKTNASPLLINDEFVSYFPALGRALGSVEDAVLVQMLWYRRDRSTNETEMRTPDLADAVGMKLRTTERRLAGLVNAGILSKRRKGAYDATSVWAVHLDQIDVSAGQPESATLAGSSSRIGDIESATLAGSESATLAGSIPKEQEEHPPTPAAVAAPAAVRAENPPTPASGGACARHPNNDGVNCRGCGTTNRQRAKTESADAAAMRRAQDAEELRRARANKPDPEVGHRGAAVARAAMEEALQARRGATQAAPAGA